MLTRLHRFTRNHPRSTAFIIMGGFAALLVLPYALQGPTDALADAGVMSLNALLSAIIWQTLLCLVLLGLTALLHWQDIVGFTGPLDRKGLPAFVGVLALPAMMAIILAVGLMGDGQTASPLRLIMIILSLNAMVGLSEELLFRGFVFGALRQKHRLITAIVVSSVLFGLIHAVNLGAGQSGTATTYQIINAVMLGALFCAIRLQTNSLWPPVALHMVWNVYVMLGVYTSLTKADTETDQIALGIDILVIPTLLLIITAIMLWRYQSRTGKHIAAIHPITATIST